MRVVVVPFVNPALSVGMGSDVKGLDSPVCMSVLRIPREKTHECGYIPRFAHGDWGDTCIRWLPGASWLRLPRASRCGYCVVFRFSPFVGVRVFPFVGVRVVHVALCCLACSWCRSYGSDKLFRGAGDMCVIVANDCRSM